MQASPVDKARKPVASSEGLKKHSGYSLHFEYKRAKDADSNLLIFLHGLGDTCASFFTLGQQLQTTLPQTAILSLQAPHRVPLLEEQAWMWWDSFDSLGELIVHPDPRQTIASLHALFTYLTTTPDQGGCGWPAANIHLFGYAQGGYAMLEALVAWKGAPLGSAVAVCSQLLSLPTSSKRCSTPLAFTTRWERSFLASSQAQRQVTWAERAFAHVQHINLPGSGETMIHGAEWKEIIPFWSKYWRNRSSWEREGEVLAVS